MNHNEIREEFARVFRLHQKDFGNNPDLNKITNWWLDKLTLSYNAGIEKSIEVVKTDLKQELLFEVGEDEAEYEHEDFLMLQQRISINEERARVRAIINKKL
jgi:hypothetical protein